MKKYLLSFLLIIIAFKSLAFNYNVGYTDTSFYDNTRSNRAVGVRIYYPAIATGQQTAIVSDGTRFPVVAFGHGFVMSGLAYTWLANALVKEGYIVASLRSEEGLPPVHDFFGEDEVFIATYIKNLGNNINSIFYNKTSIYNAIGGHSMGGGASFLGMKGENNITTFFNFAAAETFLFNSAINAGGQIKQPCLVFGGKKDCVAPPENNNIPMYKNLKSEYKIHINLDGASHCQFSDPNTTICEAGELVACLSTGFDFITATEQHNRTISYLLPWLNFWLKRDCNEINTFYGNIATSLNNIDTLQSKTITCAAITTTTAIKENAIKISAVFPNPNKGNFNVEIPENSQNINCILMDISGRIIAEKQFFNTKNLNFNYSNLSKGMYNLKITTTTNSYFAKINIE